MRTTTIFSLLVLLLLITSQGIVMSNFRVKLFAISPVEYMKQSSVTYNDGYNHIQIIGKHWVMNETLTVSSTDIVEIINSTLDFSNVDTDSGLIVNYGTLIINNSRIISDLSKDYTYAVKSEGNLTVINSSFENKKLLVDFNKRTVITIYAILQQNQATVFYGNYFENYTSAFKVDNAKVEVIHNNTFVNCPFGIEIFASNLIISNNTFINSIAAGISGSGPNVTVQNNYLFNDRNLLQTDVDLFGDITKGIDISGSQNHIINNTIINTFKSIVTFDSDHVIVERNRIDTTGATEGEIQAEGSDYLVYRNNYITNQWDSIEIYNCRHLLIEGNYIENGVTAIRVERVDEYGGVDPLNVTIQYNIVTNSGFIGIEHGINVKIQHNVLNSTDIKLTENTVNAIVYNNTVYKGNIILFDSKNIFISNNHIKSSIIGVIQLRCQNVTLSNNMILGFGEIVPIPDILLGIDLFIITLAIIIIIALSVILIKRRRKR